GGTSRRSAGHGPRRAPPVLPARGEESARRPAADGDRSRTGGEGGCADAVGGVCDADDSAGDVERGQTAAARQGGSRPDDAGARRSTGGGQNRGTGETGTPCPGTAARTGRSRTAEPACRLVVSR